MPGQVTTENLDEVFRYHGPDPDQVAAYEKINTAAKEFARVVLENAPACADRSAALRKIREARMDANSAVALRGLV